jgi:hypothetical protein
MRLRLGVQSQPVVCFQKKFTFFGRICQSSISRLHSKTTIRNQETVAAGFSLRYFEVK